MYLRIHWVRGLIDSLGYFEKKRNIDSNQSFNNNTAKHDTELDYWGKCAHCHCWVHYTRNSMWLASLPQDLSLTAHGKLLLCLPSPPASNGFHCSFLNKRPSGCVWLQCPGHMSLSYLQRRLIIDFRFPHWRDNDHNVDIAPKMERPKVMRKEEYDWCPLQRRWKFSPYAIC